VNVNPTLHLVETTPPQPEAAAPAGPEQVEMPFAVVHGEPITVLPPPSARPGQAPLSS
jgi:hypothetical protein